MQETGRLYVRNFLFRNEELILGDWAGHLCLCYWTASRLCPVVESRILQELHSERSCKTTALLDKTASQLEEFQKGVRLHFELPLLLLGTDFQRTVWRTLQEEPYGSTCSYRTVAEKIGRPPSVWAVANALAHNPLQLIIPCHRVVGADGRPTGYAGGLPLKSFLLQLEKSRAALSEEG